jgi:hypothetical protein
MDIKDIKVPCFEVDLTPRSVSIVDADKALSEVRDRNVRARLKPEILNYWKQNGSMDEYTCKGFKICNSKITQKWWVMDNDGVFMGYAKDYAEARAMIMKIIAGEQADSPEGNAND